MVFTNPHYSIGILADDLTSAADGVGPFVARGLRARIGRNTVPKADTRVIAVDSGSRSQDAAGAAAKVSALTPQLATCQILYKTVDSTLRGHVMAELAAAFARSGRKAVIFAPAFPAAGRTTVNGVQFVDGVPVSNTIYGRDPVHPARTSVLADLVPSSIGRVTLLDATTQEELDAQVAAVSHPEEILWVGSPGMALALARAIGPEGLAVLHNPAVNHRAVLVVVGTANPLSHAQANPLGATNNIVLLTAPTGRGEPSGIVLDRIAAEAVKHLETGQFGALIATGGETAAAILDRLKVRELEVLHELEPGFPLGFARLPDGGGLLIALKAGGFGDDRTLVNAVARLMPDPRRATHRKAL